MIFQNVRLPFIRRIAIFVSGLGIILGLFLVYDSNIQAQSLFQQPTGSIPTVTGTPTGVVATVLLGQEPQINVRSGPGTFYDKVGVLLPGQIVPVLGKSAGGDWILIQYLGIPSNQGWVYSPFVRLSPGTISIIEPPPTSTPLYTPTIDPTLAAQFIETPRPTKLPTFTQSPPLVIPTFQDASPSSTAAGLPLGLVIIILGGAGILIGLFSFLQTR
jgi:hypothetical protein